MKIICHPIDDMEQAFIVASLEAAGIPFFIIGQYFGGVYPGIQIPSYNERSIQIPDSYLEEAYDIVKEVRAHYIAPSENLATKSKLRIIAEALLIGWAIPGGKKSSNK